MDQKQLELNFCEELDSAESQGSQVVMFDVFLKAREARKHLKNEHDQARLIATIVKSVEHITGRSPEAEAM